MSKIDLDPLTSGYNLSKINVNFQKIEDELNNKVLYRNSPSGEPNNMSSNLDMNGRSILNASKISGNVLELGGVQVVPTSLVVDPYNGTREALRRSHAEAGYNLVDGSFEAGGTLVNANDVLLQERTGKAFTGPAGHVSPDTNPSGGGFIDVSDRVMYVAFSGYADTAQGAISSTANSGMTMHLKKGTHEGLTLKNGSLLGQGYGTVINDGLGGYALRVLSFAPNWRRQYIRDVQLTAKTTYSGFGVTYDPADIVSGRWNLEYVGISGFDVCIKKPQGNIGNLYSSVSFSTANYGYRSTDGTLGTMHSGNDRFSECHWMSIQKWCVDIECKTDGGGQIVIENSIMEQCNGGGVRINLGGKVPYTPVVLKNLWFEQICKAATVDRDGVTEIPRQVKLIDAPVVYSEECYLTNVELINSTLIASKCRIDSASGSNPVFILDNLSYFEISDLYANGAVGGVPTVKSVSAQTAQAQSQNLSLKGLPTITRVIKPQAGSIKVKNTYDGTVGTTTWTFPGSVSTRVAQCVADGVVEYSCAELSIVAGEVQTSTEVCSAVSGKWYVWGISTKLISGSGSFKFEDTMSFGEIYTATGKWVSTFGVAKAGVSGNVKLRLSATTAVTLRMKDFFIAEFDSESDALAFCNTRAALK